MEQCSETSAYKIQMPGNYPEESMQHCKLVVSCKLNPYVAFYFTLKYRTVGPMVVINERNMQLYRNKERKVDDLFLNIQKAKWEVLQ